MATAEPRLGPTNIIAFFMWDFQNWYIKPIHPQHNETIGSKKTETQRNLSICGENHFLRRWADEHLTT